MQRPRSGLARLFAWPAMLSLIVSTGPMPLAAPAPPSASFAGRIFLADAKTPVGEATVNAFNLDTEKTFKSVATGTDGAYALEGLPPGKYEIGISTAAGIYVVATNMSVAAGQTRAASFALQPYASGDAAADAPRQGSSPQAGTEAGSEPQQTPKTRKLRGSSTAGKARSAWVATGIIVGGALVVGVIANSGGDSNGSPNR